MLSFHDIDRVIEVVKIGGAPKDDGRYQNRGSRLESSGASSWMSIISSCYHSRDLTEYCIKGDLVSEGDQSVESIQIATNDTWSALTHVPCLCNYRTVERLSCPIADSDR